MFNLLIVQPIFNLLVLIYAVLPGHNFGLALVLFTILIRILMGPVIKKQLHHAKAMRQLQPELKRIKQATKGDKQKESAMVMQLYKEREVSPFGSIGVLVVQLVILLGLYSGLNRVVKDPQAIIDFSYPILRDLSWLKSLADNIQQFDATLLGVVDLTRPAFQAGNIYWPAMLIVFGSSVAQFFQSKQLMPTEKDARSIRQILRDASSGQQSDAAEMNAAVSRNMRFVIPVLIFFFTVNLPSALGLYWLVSGVVAYWQQARILKKDEQEMETIAAKPGKSRQVIEGEVIPKKKSSNKKSKTSKKSAKRRKT